jgi:hypothetical protein
VSFAIPRGYEAPGAPTGAQWLFQVAAKAFEENTPALLQTAINAWLLTLQADDLEYSMLSVNYQSGAKERALVTYGFFVNVIDA